MIAMAIEGEKRELETLIAQAGELLERSGKLIAQLRVALREIDACDREAKRIESRPLMGRLTCSARWRRNDHLLS